MFNWLALKKFVVCVSIIGAIVSPIHFIKYGQNEEKPINVSDYKKILLGENREQIYNGKTIEDFLNDLLKTNKGRFDLQQSFAEKLLSSLIFSRQNSVFKNKIEQILIEEEIEFKKKQEELTSSDNLQTELFDKYGGSRKRMKELFINKKVYELFKNSIIDSLVNNFTFNKNWDEQNNDNFFIERSHYVNEEDLKTSNNWRKIGFFPKKNTDFDLINNSDKQHTIGKFDFLNWSYKHWYKNHLPFYTLMSFWKYDAAANKEKLKQKYDSKVEKYLPNTANYQFPLFSDASKEKFKDFIKNIDSFEIKQNNISFLNIPIKYTDDTGTNILVETINSHEKLFTEFASGALYLYQNSILANDKTQNLNASCLDDAIQTNPTVLVPTSPNTNIKINIISKVDLKKLEDPVDLFLEKVINSATDTKGLKIDKTIIKSVNNKDNDKDTVYDVREVKDNNWLFLRNQEGVHAITIDGADYINTLDNGVCKLRKSFDWFNFRNLQFSLNNSKLPALKGVETSGLNIFKEYLKQNFDELILNYFFNHENSQKYLFQELTKAEKSYFQKYKETIVLIDEIAFYAKKYSSIFLLRSKIIEAYTNREWEIDSSSKKFKVVAAKFGLSAKFPYKYLETAQANLEFFPNQEKLFSLIQHQKSSSTKTDVVANPSVNIPSVTSSIQIDLGGYEQLMLNKYKNSVDKLLKSLKINIRTDQLSFLESNYIFIEDEIMDDFLQKSLENSQLLNFIIKKDFLINGPYVQNLLNNKNLLLQNADEMSALINANTTSNDWFTKLDFDKKFYEFVRKNYFSNLYWEKNTKWFNLLKHYHKDINAANSNTSSNLKPIDELKKSLLDYSFKNFKSNYYFSPTLNREHYFNFLIASSYLTRNNFENLRIYLKNRISKKLYSYLIFGKQSSTFIATSEKDNYVDVLSNPFLKHDDKNTKKFEFNTIDKFQSIIDYLNSIKINNTTAVSSSSGGGGSGGGGGSTVQNDLWNFKELSINNRESKSDHNLFSFKNRDELIKYVKNIDNTEEFNDLIALLKDKNQNWKLQILEVLAVNVSDDNKSKNLFLQDKKNGLISFINNYALPEEDKLNKEKIKEIYGYDVDEKSYVNPFVSVKKTNKDSNHKENIADNLFTRIKKEKDSQYVLQINQDDVENEENFKKFLNENLNSDMLEALIYNLTNNSDIKDIAIKNFALENRKLDVYDARLKKNLNSVYLAN